jgi:hypothetical protein
MRTLPAAFALALACCTAGASLASPLGDRCLARAPKLLDSFVSGDYAGTNQQLGPFMRMMSPPESLKDDWNTMNHEYGAYVSHGKPAVYQDDGKNAFIRTPMTFAHRNVTMQIACSKDSGGQIDSMVFL